VSWETISARNFIIYWTRIIYSFCHWVAKDVLAMKNHPLCLHCTKNCTDSYPGFLNLKLCVITGNSHLLRLDLIHRTDTMIRVCCLWMTMKNTWFTVKLIHCLFQDGMTLFYNEVRKSDSTHQNSVFGATE
jgi:hypothetical protein